MRSNSRRHRRLRSRASTLTVAVAMLTGCLLATTIGCSVFTRNGEGRSLEKTIANILPGQGTEEINATTAGESALSKKAGRSDKKDEKATPISKVRLDGSLSLGDTENLAFSPKQLAEALTELYEANKSASISHLVQLYPDIIAKLLIKPNGLSLEARTDLAKRYQQRWGGGEEAIDALIRSYKSGTTNAILKGQTEFLTYLENNRPKDALNLRIARQVSKNPLLAAEALRLEAMAHMMLEHDDRSSQLLSKAVGLLSDHQPLEANRVRLLLGETLRRNGKMDGWKESWVTAVKQQSRWLETNQLADPQFWKQAAFLRPVSESWPSEAIQRLRTYAAKSGLNFDKTDTEESVVWAVVGINSLKRHEPQNAILSFKKSESTIADRFLKKELQMQQAIAMIDGGQAGPASAILFRLSSENGVLADRAKAILATLKLQNGSLAQGMSLLQSAIRSSASWPAEERLRAQADYGLAYLMRGKEAQGIELLNRVHIEFLKRRDWPQATQCLFNLATYYEKTDKHREHKAALKRLETLEANTL